MAIHSISDDTIKGLVQMVIQEGALPEVSTQTLEKVPTLCEWQSLHGRVREHIADYHPECLNKLPSILQNNWLSIFFSWGKHTQQEVTMLAYYLKQHKRVIEVMAGNGYLSAHLRKLGVKNLTAQDYHARSEFYPAGKTAVWTEVEQVDLSELSDDQMREYLLGYDAVVMVWPPYQDGEAHRVVSNMASSATLYYLGGDMTGDDALQETLRDSVLWNDHRVLEEQINEKRINHWERPRTRGIDNNQDSWVIMTKQ